MAFLAMALLVLVPGPSVPVQGIKTLSMDEGYSQFLFTVATAVGEILDTFAGVVKGSSVSDSFKKDSLTLLGRLDDQTEAMFKTLSKDAKNAKL